MRQEAAGRAADDLGGLVRAACLEGEVERLLPAGVRPRVIDDQAAEGGEALGVVGLQAAAEEVLDERVESQLARGDLVEQALVAKPKEVPAGVVEPEDIRGQADGDRARHGRRQHEPLHRRRLGSQNLLGEVAVEGLGGPLLGERELGGERRQADHRGPPVGLPDEGVHRLGRVALEHPGRLLFGHCELVAPDLVRLVGDEAAGGRPAGPPPRGHENADWRKGQEPVEERLHRSRLRHEVVIVENDDPACRPRFEILSEELGERSGEALGGVADAEALAHALAGAGNDGSDRLGEPCREGADIGRCRGGSVPGGVLPALEPFTRKR